MNRPHTRCLTYVASALCTLVLAAGAASPLLRPMLNGMALRALSPSGKPGGPEPQPQPAPTRAAATAAPPDTTRLPYPLHDEGDVPASGAGPAPSTLDLKQPGNAEYSVRYDPQTGGVVVYRRVGGINVRLPYSMSLADYNNDAVRRSMIDYWMSQQQAASAAGRMLQGGPGDGDKQKNTILNAKWQIKSAAFESIFGSNQISMKLAGQAQISLGVQYHKIDNPTLQERMRATTSFDFDQSVQVNLDAQVGEKLHLGINYNTQATFDFENEVKLEYNGDEDDIIQNIEAGNVNWSLPGTLIQGSQSLFGFKLDLKFGKLSVSGVFSQKRGESQTMTVQNGATKQEFDIDITDYQKNQHFFLSHRFKEMYDQALQRLPTINSGVTINRIEVWVTNKSGNYTDARNVVGFTDLGETGGDLSDPQMWSGRRGAMPDNAANNLYASMTQAYSAARDPNTATQTLTNIPGMRTARDFEKVENARMLSPSEYTVNEHLGYISLNTPLNNNEVLAVAYQYTYRGETYTVGELSTQGVNAPKCLYLKLLKGTTLTPSYKNWDLMMKNVYSLGAFEIEAEDFDLNIVYCNDSTSSYLNYYNEGPRPVNGGRNGETYLQILNLDRLNSYQQLSPDGKYDYVEGVTINARRGLVIFPEREPFGEYLRGKLQAATPQTAEKLAFTALYDSTQVFAKQQTKKNKFKLRGSFASQNSSEISLNAFNIAQGSVRLTAGGQTLQENVDYTVDYSLGRVKILNAGILASGTPIQIAYENEATISTQTQTLVGAHLDYEFNPNFHLGGTIIHMKERPLTNKVAYGEESISNTMLGVNLDYARDLPAITRGLDALPMVSTKAKSSVAIEAEIAKLIAGHSSSINAAYIDDFEGSSVKYDIKAWNGWHLASRPQGSGALSPDATAINDLSAGFDRARICWYTIDPLFLRNMSNTPRHIKYDREQKSNHYVREVYEDEIYPNREASYGESTNLSMLNVMYYPKEPGPYNFTTDLDARGHFEAGSEQRRWGGIQRKLETTDFEQQNIEYIEFWLMDPFIYTAGKAGAGADVYFQVGNVSEDVLQDSRKSFENGLPVPGQTFDVDSTAWGYIPRSNSLIKGFNTDAASMRAQDVGLNGMSSERERGFYADYMRELQRKHAAGLITDSTYEARVNDPAGDDFHYYRGSDFDDAEVSITDRYKRFNNTEGNSCPSEYSTETYTTAASNVPDNEDLNDDYTLNENESYYQYHLNIRPEAMQVGQNHIADMMETTKKLDNGNTETIKWYQFKIPLSQPDKVVGDMGDMSSMQFMRLVMTNCEDTTILRFASLDLVRGEWRKYTEPLVEPDGHTASGTTFSTNSVNIEENDRRTPVNYVLPPSVDRVVDPSNPQLRQLNEQAYSLKVEELANGDARAVYKTLNMDFRNYRRLRMYIHCEAPEGYSLDDNQVSAFVRLGSDYEDNYYEYEVPLKLTPHGWYTSNNESDRYQVWPVENELDLPFSLLSECKLQRNAKRREYGSGLTLQDVYTMSDPDNNKNHVRIKGNPSTGNVVVMMLGVRAHGAGTKSAEVWFNELRLTDFNERGGWAARGRGTLKLADVASVQLSGQYASVGFGGIDQSVLERALDENKQFDVSANIDLGKFMGPKSPMSMPVFASYSKSTSTPLYSPYDSDVKMSTVLAQAQSKHEEDSLKRISQTTETIRSVNLTNLRAKPKAGKKTTMLSATNWSASYALNETVKTDPETEYDKYRQHNGSIGYNFTAGGKPVTPFKNSKMNPKVFGIIKDLTFYAWPSLFGYRWDVTRDYQEVQKRNITNPDYKIPLSVTKSFFWNRYFDFRYNITRNLKFGFSGQTNARIEEPDGPVNKHRYKEEFKHWKDSVLTNIGKFGKADHYSHNVDIQWTVPINKLPGLSFLSANATYKGMYDWQRGTEVPEFEWGNVINNSNNEQANGMVNFSTLYNKSQYLRDLFNRSNLSSSNRQKRAEKNGEKTKTVTYSQQGLKFAIGQPLVVEHKLNTTDVSVRAFDAKGHSLKGILKPLDNNRAQFTPTMASNSARVVITGTITEKDEKARRNLFKDIVMSILTSPKSASISYSRNNSTTLYGYLPGCHFMGTGASPDEGLRAPGFRFMIGLQDRQFAMKAYQKGWLTVDSTFNDPYLMSRSEQLQIRGSFEMFRALKVELTWQWQKDKRLTEYYRMNGSGLEGVFGTVEDGTFSMSYAAIRTAFQKPEKTGNLNYSVYRKFLDARRPVSYRQAEARTPGAGAEEHTNEERGDGGADGYGLMTQDVLIPAFLAAYSDHANSGIFLDLLPSIGKMLPNWRVTFSGLNNIPSIKNAVRNIELSHSYTCKYSVGQFTTNLDWRQGSDGLSWARDIDDNFVPRYDVGTVTLSEQFNPFLGLSATFVNNLTTSIAINKTRNLALNVANKQITETYGRDWSLNVGYRFDNVKLFVKKSKRGETSGSNLNLTFGLAIRDSYSLLRRIEERKSELAQGSKTTQIKVSADYAVNSLVNVQFYYDQSLAKPYISSSYPTNNINVGFSLQVRLTD